MRESISYSKLPSGAWGVRIATKGRHPNPGDEVFVQKRDGSTNRVTLGGIVDRDRGAFPGPAVYYAIARRNRKTGNYPYRNREAERQAAIREGQRVAALVASIDRSLAGHLAAAADGWDGEYSEEEGNKITADLRTALREAQAMLERLRADYSRRYLGRAA